MASVGRDSSTNVSVVTPTGKDPRSLSASAETGGVGVAVALAMGLAVELAIGVAVGLALWPSQATTAKPNTTTVAASSSFAMSFDRYAAMRPSVSNCNVVAGIIASIERRARCQRRRATMPKAKVNGVELNYEVHGGGYPLVLAHGFTSSLQMWADQIPSFAKKYRVVVYDSRGHGASEAPGDLASYDLWTCVEDQRALMDHLDIGEAYVGGRAVGGRG